MFVIIQSAFRKTTPIHNRGKNNTVVFGDCNKVTH